MKKLPLWQKLVWVLFILTVPGLAHVLAIVYLCKQPVIAEDPLPESNQIEGNDFTRQMWMED